MDKEIETAFSLLFEISEKLAPYYKRGEEEAVRASLTGARIMMLATDERYDAQKEHD